MPALSTAFALVALLSERVDVQGSSTCPSPAEVAERIAPLVPAERGFPPDAVLRVDEGAAEVEVRFEGAGDPAPLASRRLARNGSCGGRGRRRGELGGALRHATAGSAGTLGKPWGRGGG